MMKAVENAERALLEMKERARAFAACDGHTFVDATPERTVGKRWYCRRCGGSVDSTAKLAYEQGVQHGRAELMSLRPIREIVIEPPVVSWPPTPEHGFSLGQSAALPRDLAAACRSDPDGPRHESNGDANGGKDGAT